MKCPFTIIINHICKMVPDYKDNYIINNTSSKWKTNKDNLEVKLDQMATCIHNTNNKDNSNWNRVNNKFLLIIKKNQKMNNLKKKNNEKSKNKINFHFILSFI